MDWLTALCTGTGCSIDGSAEVLNPISDFVEKWTRVNLGRVMNIITPESTQQVVDAMNTMSLNRVEGEVRDMLEDSLNVMESAWKESQRDRTSRSRTSGESRTRVLGQHLMRERDNTMEPSWKESVVLGHLMRERDITNRDYDNEMESVWKDLSTEDINLSTEDINLSTEDIANGLLDISEDEIPAILMNYSNSSDDPENIDEILSNFMEARYSLFGSSMSLVTSVMTSYDKHIQKLGTGNIINSLEIIRKILEKIGMLEGYTFYKILIDLSYINNKSLVSYLLKYTDLQYRFDISSLEIDTMLPMFSISNISKELFGLLLKNGLPIIDEDIGFSCENISILKDNGEIRKAKDLQKIIYWCLEEYPELIEDCSADMETVFGGNRI